MRKPANPGMKLRKLIFLPELMPVINQLRDDIRFSSSAV
jgi:hypothetical protein